MKVFISGPMSGKPNFNREAFFKAQEELEKLGYSVWNPAWLAYPSDTDFSKDAIHAIDNEALRHCDAIYLLKGWKYSEGARNEYKIAIARNLDIMYEEELWYSFRFNLSKVPEKNAPEFDKESLRLDSYNNCRLDNHADRIGTLEDKVEAIKESIGTDNLQEQLEKDFADVYEEFQNTKDQVNDINMGYIKWSSEVSQFDERIEKLEENMKEIAANKRDILSIKNDIDIIHSWINIHDRIHKAESKQLSDLGSELDDYKEDYKHLNNADEALERYIKSLEKKYDELNHAVGIQGKEIGGIIQRRCDDNQVVNNMLNDINIRLKAIEKRLDIKPFYAPTEDEKDDD